MKAKLLTELVLNCEDKKIRIDNKRLIRATKFMIFFSYFLPKVFQWEFKDFIEKAKLNIKENCEVCLGNEFREDSHFKYWDNLSWQGDHVLSGIDYLEDCIDDLFDHLFFESLFDGQYEISRDHFLFKIGGSRVSRGISSIVTDYTLISTDNSGERGDHFFSDKKNSNSIASWFWDMG